ncbi:hypothetical protein WJX77_000131 [Trebouxia sp. C0004]
MVCAASLAYCAQMHRQDRAVLAQHPKASDTLQLSPFLQQIAGLSSQEVNQDLVVAASLLHSLLNNNQHPPASAAGFINAEGDTRSPAPPNFLGCAQLVHHAAKFVSVPTLLAVARASLHFLQAELRGVVYWLNLLRHCEASLEQLTWDAEKLDREHADEAVLLNRQAKENKLLKEQSNMQERMEEVVESLPRLQQTTETLVSNIGGMCAAPCWAPHFFKLAKDSDGCCSPNHSVPDMATTMAALHEAHLLSDRTLDFIKSCFVTHEM